MLRLFRAMLLWAVLTPLAAAQPFVALDAGAQFRDAVVMPSGRLFVAVHDRNEVWEMDPASHTRLRAVPSGKGPIALALSPDAKYLACACHLDNTVTIYAMPELAPIASVPVGKGPVGITATPDTRFLVPNSFSDTVSIIDPAFSAQVNTLEKLPPVPIATAATESVWAVAGRGSSELWLYSKGDANPFRRIALPGDPLQIATVSGDRFVVLTKPETLIVAARSGDITARKASQAAHLAVSGDSLYFLNGLNIDVLSPTLETRAQETLSLPSERIAAGNGLIIALSPGRKTWQIHGRISQASPLPAPIPPVPDLAAVVEATTVTEATPIEDSSSTPAPAEAPVTPEIVEPLPPPAPAEALPEAISPPHAGENIVAAEPSSAPLPEKPAKRDFSRKDKNAQKVQIQQQPHSNDQVSRLRSSSRPSPSPLLLPTRRSLSDALIQPTEFGSIGSGFEPPDWTEPLRDVEAGRSRTDLVTGKTELSEQVKLRLGNMYFEADEFAYSDEAGQYNAKGNVLVAQESSKFTTDEIYYTVPPEGELPSPTIFKPEMTEQERAKQRLSLGHVKALNVHIEEPTREMSVEELDYDFATSSGELINARGRAGIFYYKAERLKLNGPQSLEADDVWVTTCDHENPHYRIRMKHLSIEEGKVTGGSSARLQLGNAKTPFFLPNWRQGGTSDHPWTLDFSSGRRAKLGYYLNVGQMVEMTPDWSIGPRFFFTEKEGVGFGGDLTYDFLETPSSRLYRTQGEIHGFYTTKERGYIDWKHRYEYSDDLVLRMQAEQWSDRDFYKDFYYDAYRHRTTPRSFANVTYRQPGYIATGTARIHTHNWVRETERLPEATFHLLERPLGGGLFVSFDTIAGYNDRAPRGDHGVRSINIARLSYDFDPIEGLSLTPFYEVEGAWYSDRQDTETSATRFSNTIGLTAQTRLHRNYDGFWGFSGFKHIIVPSITYSYRPKATLAFDRTPHYDLLDNTVGRSRIETSIANVVYGRDAESGEVWQVGRLNLYQGNDFWNETRKTDDYEIEIDIRPRIWWGFQLAAERHVVSSDFDLNDPYSIQQTLLEWYERIVGRPVDPRLGFDYNARYGDYNRILTQLYYDNTPLGGKMSGRLGFSYTETQNRIFNREVLYGMGYQLGKKWNVAFEHRYDLEDDTMRSQTYTLSRIFHCIETSVRFRDRESGFDIDFAINIAGFPGSRVKF